MSTIPKVIHYCWFGGNELPRSAKRCIASWKKYMPQYEIKEWNETNFDIHCCKYVEEAYKNKKWAFVSDFARFRILYEEGGIYLDTDVEIIKPLHNIVEQGSFMGRQHNCFVNPGLIMAFTPKNELLGELLELYCTLNFVEEDGSLNLKTIVQYTTEMLEKYGLRITDEFQNVAGINIYPQEYFSPKDPVFKTINISENTYTIHHFDGTWLPIKNRVKCKIQSILGPQITGAFVDLKHFFKDKRDTK